MAKVKNANRSEKDLFAQMKKLSKRTNQRILRIERLTGFTEGFAVKELIDRLSIEPLQAITKTGRVAVRKDFSNLQMKAIIKAMNNFLANPLSTQRGIKKYSNDLSKEAGETLTFSQANVYYQASGNFKWIIDYFPSSFWDIARESVRENWNVQTFIDKVGAMLDKEVDESIKTDLENLYDYTRDTRI